MSSKAKHLPGSIKSKGQERCVQGQARIKKDTKATNMKKRQRSGSENRHSDQMRQLRGQILRDRPDDKLLPSQRVNTHVDTCSDDADSNKLDGLQDLCSTYQDIVFASACRHSSDADLRGHESRAKSSAAEASGVRQRNAALLRKAKGGLNRVKPQQGLISGSEESHGYIGNEAKLRLPIGLESCSQHSLTLQKRVQRAVLSSNFHYSGMFARSVCGYRVSGPSFRA